MDVRALQKQADDVLKNDPQKACEFLRQAFELDKNNKFTLSKYGQALRNANRPKEYIDLCEKLNNHTLLQDKWILAWLCWCHYDYYIKPFSVEGECSHEDFFNSAEFIVNNCKQPEAKEHYINPYIITIRKVVKVLEQVNAENYDLQLEWLNKIDIKSLPAEKQTKDNENGERQEYDSLKEQVCQQICWVIYKQKIKYYSEETSNDGFEEFLDSAEFITTNCFQKNAEEHNKNPFVLTVLKVVKIYKNKNNKNYKKMLEWILKLDPNILSEEVFSFVDSKGKEREKASPKEYYFQYISKIYEKLQENEKCVEICDVGLQQIKKWHYRNHVWIKARREYCSCLISTDFDNAVKEYIKIAEKEKHWFMYHKVSSLFFERGNLDSAILYAAKAFDAYKIEPETMINLIFDFGLLLQAKSKQTQANIFFQTHIYYRNLSGWNLREELRFMIEDHNLDVKQKPNLQQLKQITQEYNPKNNLNSGVILKILPNKAGFIKQKDNSQIYFRSTENKRFVLNDKVMFEVGSDNLNRPIATNVQKTRR